MRLRDTTAHMYIHVHKARRKVDATVSRETSIYNYEGARKVREARVVTMVRAVREVKAV